MQGMYAYNDNRKEISDNKESGYHDHCPLVIKRIQYKDLIKKLKDNKIELNRKVLADLAVDNPEVFSFIVKSL
jgi:ribosomal protein L20